MPSASATFAPQPALCANVTTWGDDSQRKMPAERKFTLTLIQTLLLIALVGVLLLIVVPLLGR